MNNLWLFFKYVYIILNLILWISLLDFSDYRVVWEQHYLWILSELILFIEIIISLKVLF